MHSSKSAIHFKKASTADVELIQTLVTPIWRQTYLPIVSEAQVEWMLETLYSTEELSRLITSNEQRFVIMYGEQALGFAAWSVHQDSPLICKLNKLYLSPEQKGKGYGKLLLQEIEKQCRALGAERLILNVNRFNPSKAFYHKMNYQVLQEVDIPIGKFFMNDYVMGKDLTTEGLV